MKKKAIACILTACMLTLSPLCAQADAAKAPAVYYSETGGLTQSIEPRLNYLSSVFTHLVISGSYAQMQGNYTIFSNMKVRLQVVMQHSSNNSTWSNVSGESWSQTWITSGQHILPCRSHAPLAHGYYYRAQTTATVLSSSGAPLETVIVYSNPSYYA